MKPEVGKLVVAVDRGALLCFYTGQHSLIEPGFIRFVVVVLLPFVTLP
jgi:hypothetical protein